MTLTILIPIRTVSTANVRWHWRTRAKLARDQRWLTNLMFVTSQRIFPNAPVNIKLTRLSPGTLDGHDNLRISLKHVVDGIADFYCIDDGSDLFAWEYGQERSKEYGVRVEISER